jgi:hypothetical protein
VAAPVPAPPQPPSQQRQMPPAPEQHQSWNKKSTSHLLKRHKKKKSKSESSSLSPPSPPSSPSSQSSLSHQLSSLPPPPPSSYRRQSRSRQQTQEETTKESRYLKISKQPVFSLREVCERVASHSNRLVEDEKRIERDLASYAIEKEQSDQKCDELQGTLSQASKRHNFFAKLRVFLIDITACLSVKRPMILDLIAAQNKIRKETSELLKLQRHYDLEDTIRSIQQLIQNNGNQQKVQLLFAHANNPILSSWDASSLSSSSTIKEKKVDEFGRIINSDVSSTGAQVLRLQERKKRWEERNVVNNANKNSSESSHFRYHPWNNLSSATLSRALEREKGVHDASIILFNDVRKDLRNTSELIHMFQLWSMNFYSDFKMTYAALSMPEIFEWYSRVALLRWNPLKNNDSYLSVASILEWNTGHSDEDQSKDHNTNTQQHWERTTSLVQSSLVKTCIIPHVEWHIEHVWDPSIIQETMNLVHVVEQLKLNVDILLSDKDWSSDSLNIYNQLNVKIIKRLQKDVSMIKIPIVQTEEQNIFSIGTMESDLIANHVIWATNIGLSIILCKNRMTESTCNGMLFDQILQRLLIPLMRQDTCISHEMHINQTISSFENIYNYSKDDLLLQKFKRSLMN